MVTPEHTRLISELEMRSERSWGEDALLACLKKLRDGGPTEYQIVEVRRALAEDNGFDIVYLSPSGPEVGLSARLGQMQYFGGVYHESYDRDPTATEFGQEIADFFVAEPLGTYAHPLDIDDTGLGWWGAGHARL
jgi:hypothetical protein